MPYEPRGPRGEIPQEFVDARRNEPRGPEGEIPQVLIDGIVKSARRRRVEAVINHKWTSLGNVPGAPVGDLMEVGLGFYRQYDNGRIYVSRWDGNPFHVHGAIGERYTELGGPTGRLGWPTSDDAPFPQDGAVAEFENGAIYWWPDTGAIELGNISVQYKGLYCFGETNELSASDEPYVVFGVVPEPSIPASAVKTQIYTDVDGGDARPDYIELYQGPPYGVELGLTLSENDEGDPDKYLEQVKQGVDGAGKAVALACGAFGGPPAAGVCETVWGEVAPYIVKFVNKALGTDDDIIEKWLWLVTAKQMVTMARTPLLSLSGIEYNLESKLLSDGEASYKVYLAIRAV